MKLLLLGDICPTSKNYSLFDAYDKKALFGDTLSLFERHDYSVANIECALTETDVGIEKFGPCLKAPLSTARVLKEAGLDCCSISNNHFFDFGKKGAADSIAAFKENRLDIVGFGDNYEDSRKNLVIERDGQRICIIAVCESEYSYALPDRMGSRPYDVYDTPNDIRLAKKNADRVIVLYHGGKEHCRYPSPRLLKLCRNMAECGADLVLCQHSHCIGCYEEYEGAHIVYGTGNFLFHYDGVMPEHWFEGLAVSYDTKENSVAFTPVVHNERGIELSKGEKKEELLGDFKKRNEELKGGLWYEGWKAFCESKRELYERIIASACTPTSTEWDNKAFGHFLECEAHQDVWRELFPTANRWNEL